MGYAIATSDNIYAVKTHLYIGSDKLISFLNKFDVKVKDNYPSLALGTQEMSVKQMMEAIGLKHRPTFQDNYLNPSIANGYVRLLYPDSPRHPRQKYLLTVKGLAAYEEIKK